MQDNLSYFENRPVTSPVTIIGVPLDLGKDNTGTDGGADYFREHGLLRMLQAIQVSYTDLGNVSCPARNTVSMGDKKAKYVDAISQVNAETARLVEEEIKRGRVVVALGGDHSISIGTVKGAAKAVGELGLIYIDAHPDANTYVNSPSGNIHGMVTTAILGFGHPALVGVAGEQAIVKPENLLFIGIKDIDQTEVDFIREQKIPAITPFDIEQHGLKTVCEQIQALAQRVKKVWVSFDIDSIDSQFAPATPMSTAGGLTFRELYSLGQFIGKECSLAGFDIVECMPTGDDVTKKTAYTAITFAAHLLGAEYSWYTEDYIAHEAAKQEQR